MPFPWMAAAIAATAGASMFGAHSANRANKAAAREQMAFQERMSSTAHQRQMQDMSKAGLNPTLSGKYGGASSPSGAMSTESNIAEGLPAAVSSAIAAKRLKLDAAQIASQIEVNAANAENIRSQTELNRAMRAKDLALAPLYDEAGNLIKGGISTAKSVVRNAKKAVAPPVSESRLRHMQNLGNF